MRRLEIALDCDGLLSNFMAGALVIVEEVTGKKFELSDVTEDDFIKVLGLNPSEGSQVRKVISSRRGFVTALMPYPQARQGVRRLRSLGEVFCVTSPWDGNPWWKDEREAWLALHFGIDRVHHDREKASYEADVFVDDKAKHVRAWLARRPGRTAVFWRTVHNRGENTPRGVHSIDSWDVLYQIALETARGPVQGHLPMMEDSAQ